MPILRSSDKQLADLLRKLFERTPPQHLRKTVEYFYFSHTSEAKPLEPLPSNFNELSSDVFLLIDFLDRINEEETKVKISVVKGMVERIMGRQKK